jgi:hypothetical protein
VLPGVEVCNHLVSRRTELPRQNAKPKNALAAFVAAPIGGAAVMAALALIFFGVFWRGWGAAGALAGMLFVLISIVGYLIEVFVGVPGYLLFRHFGWVRGTHWVVLGAVLGTVCGASWPLAVLLFKPDVRYGIAAVGLFAFAGLLWGAASGLTFAWIIKDALPNANQSANR